MTTDEETDRLFRAGFAAGRGREEFDWNRYCCWAEYACGYRAGLRLTEILRADETEG